MSHLTVETAETRLTLRLISLRPQFNTRNTRLSQQKPFFAVLATAFVFGLLIPPVIVEAGILDWIKDVRGKTVQAEAPVAESNSQTVGLQANSLLNPGAGSGLGGGDNTIVNGSALLAEAGPEGTLADISDTPTTDKISIYVVRPGDSLSQIAEMYGVSVNTIAWANDMTAKTPLKEGQILVILPITGVRHTVKSGETLESIAKKYKGDTEEIAQFNGIEGTKVAVGQVVIVPHGEIASAPPATTGKKPAAGSSSSAAGYYARPVKGGVRTQGLHGYNGVDIASASGAPIYAAASGQVIISREGGWNGGYGNYVVISHPNGTQTLYAHLLSNAVSAGASVTKGQVIGYMGNTGRSTGTHLHFEIRGAKNPF